MTDIAFRSSAAGRMAAQWLPAPALAVLALGAWQALCMTVYRGKGYLLPSPLDVAGAAANNATLLAGAASTTLREAVLGYVLAALLGIALAAAMSQARLLERCLYPYAVLLQTVPVVAVAPLIVLWSGYNERSVVLIALIMALFPIVNNTLLGLRSTPVQLLELFALHRTGRWRTFIRLRLPAALPHTLAGLRISAGLSVIGAIVGEFIIGAGNAAGGLGVQIVFAQGRMDTALLFAEVIAATMLGFALFAAASGAGRLLLRHWHESVR
ncbi:ABC transporter permease [Pseudoduganella dura]|nr:ABC transporter permease [Pseudoduganella dura]GGX88959.1 ABC transporter ATP-binding protein [Pseudoduganella dura]